MLRLNRDAPDSLIVGKAPGGYPRLDANQRATLAAEAYIVRTIKYWVIERKRKARGHREYDVDALLRWN